MGRRKQEVEAPEFQIRVVGKGKDKKHLVVNKANKVIQRFASSKDAEKCLKSLLKG